MTPGQAAYEKWCECINAPKFKNEPKLKLMTWAQLNLKTKSVWRSVAEAAVVADARVKSALRREIDGGKRADGPL